MLRAIQETRKIYHRGPVIPHGCLVRLVDFLKVLTGKEENELPLGSIGDDHKARLLKDGRIFWNHFVKITYTPGSLNLLRFMYRGMAVQCKRNQTGFDQIIPIYLKSDAESHLDEENITFCGIQAKNRAQHIKLEEEARNWTPENASIKLKAPHPYLVIVFSFRTKEKEQQLPPDPRRASLFFHGFGKISCLTPDIVTALKNLVDVNPDISTFDSDPLKVKYVKVSSPEAYPAISSSLAKTARSRKVKAGRRPNNRVRES